jgi:zinc transporter ZupT
MEKVINILAILAGCQMFLVGAGFVKNAWKTNEEKQKHEKRLLIVGLVVMIVGISRFLL